MNKQKTTLLPQRNIEWRTIKIETEKKNQGLTYIHTKLNRIKWINLRRSKISMWEYRGSFKPPSAPKKNKARMVNSTEKAS